MISPDPVVGSASHEMPLTMSSAMASITRYHGYLWSKVEPWIGNRVLEVGVGFGHYTRRMVGEGRHVMGCDLDAGHLKDLRVSIPSALLSIQRLDLEAPQPAHAACFGFAPDSIVLLNVLEHIRDEVGALRFLRDVAAPGARLVLIVPALSMLYNGLDREAGHNRRYSRGTLARSLKASGWSPVMRRYINLPGVPGWIAAGALARLSRARSELDAPATNSLLRFYDRFFVGISRLTDPLASRVAGLSLVAVARKT